MREILIKSALEAQKRAYAPYSDFYVGASLFTKSGTIFTGCNIENAAYGPTNCGERTAIFKAVSEGEREFSQIAVVGSLHGKPAEKFASPCGVCLQVMTEFCDPDTFQVILVKTVEEYKILTLRELLPYAFDKSSL